ncbi:hypothetical protein JTB14_014461 [Gonioctena quinquepunctata]|nr:hypothetical protein JTB14_014461 [Gonioctena quinquepunctata]
MKLGMENYICSPLDDGNSEWQRHASQMMKVGRFHNDIQYDIPKNIYFDNESGSIKDPEQSVILEENDPNFQTTALLLKVECQVGKKRHIRIRM